MKSYTLMTVVSLVMSLPLGLAAQTEEGHEEIGRAHV